MPTYTLVFDDSKPSPSAVPPEGNGVKPLQPNHLSDHISREHRIRSRGIESENARQPYTSNISDRIEEILPSPIEAGIEGRKIGREAFQNWDESGVPKYLSGGALTPLMHIALKKLPGGHESLETEDQARQAIEGASMELFSGIGASLGDMTKPLMVGLRFPFAYARALSMFAGGDAQGAQNMLLHPESAMTDWQPTPSDNMIVNVVKDSAQAALNNPEILAAAGAGVPDAIKSVKSVLPSSSVEASPLPTQTFTGRAGPSRPLPRRRTPSVSERPETVHYSEPRFKDGPTAISATPANLDPYHPTVSKIQTQLLKASDMPESEWGDYVENSELDGAKLRKVSHAVAQGEMDLNSAIELINEDQKKLVDIKDRDINKELSAAAEYPRSAESEEIVQHPPEGVSFFQGQEFPAVGDTLKDLTPRQEAILESQARRQASQDVTEELGARIPTLIESVKKAGGFQSNKVMKNLRKPGGRTPDIGEVKWMKEGKYSRGMISDDAEDPQTMLIRLNADLEGTGIHYDTLSDLLEAWGKMEASGYDPHTKAKSVAPRAPKKGGPPRPKQQQLPIPKQAATIKDILGDVSEKGGEAPLNYEGSMWREDIGEGGIGEDPLDTGLTKKKSFRKKKSK